MPNKRRAKADPPINIPNFDDIMNHPLTVMIEDKHGNQKKMYMDEKLHLISVDESGSNTNIKSSNESLNVLTEKNSNKNSEEFDFNKEDIYDVPKEYESITIKKSILRSKNNNKENNVNRTSTSRVMFSSPLIKYSPTKQCNSMKELLFKQFKNCQETPILPSRRPVINTFDNDSFNIDNLTQSSLTAIGVVPSKMNINQNESNVGEEISFQVIKAEDRKKWMLEAKRRSRWIRRTTQGVNDSFWDAFHADDSESVILKLCATPAVQPFAKIFPIRTRKHISKIGEGSFGEVFSVRNADDELTVVKLIPVQGDIYYNGGPQTSFDDVIAEIIVNKELSDMGIGELNRCHNFVQIKSVSLACGRFPAYFQKEWDKANKSKISENDNPKKFGSNQKWIVMQFEFAGCPLENFQVVSWNRAYSILVQTSLALACAENYLEFEHRDLHVGNLLILERPPQESADVVIIDGRSFPIEHHGVTVTIIDFTFSRIRKGTNLVYTDMAKDKDIFLGTGDIQFDVYRQMQMHNRNEWKSFNPKTNIQWLTYLGMKLSEMSLEGPRDHEDRFLELMTKISAGVSAMDLVQHIYQ